MVTGAQEGILMIEPKMDFVEKARKVFCFVYFLGVDFAFTLVFAVVVLCFVRFTLFPVVLPWLFSCL